MKPALSVGIFARRDIFSERGSVRNTSRSTSKKLRRADVFSPAAADLSDTAALLWLRLRHMAVISFFLCQTLILGAMAAQAAPRERILINDNWRFTKGDPTSFESFQSHDCKAFNGRCLVIVRGIPGQSGKIKVAATADSLKIGTAFIKTTLENK
jgi:hypothetical protein